MAEPLSGRDVIGRCGVCRNELHWIWNREFHGQQELRSNETGVYCRPGRDPSAPLGAVNNADPKHRLFPEGMLADPEAVERWLDDEEE